MEILRNAMSESAVLQFFVFEMKGMRAIRRDFEEELLLLPIMISGDRGRPI